MSAQTLSPDIDRLITDSVRAAFEREVETADGQVRLAALLERHGWTCRAPAARVACGKRTQGVR